MMRDIKELDDRNPRNLAEVVRRLNEVIRLLNDHEMRVGHATERV